MKLLKKLIIMIIALLFVVSNATAAEKKKVSAKQNEAQKAKAHDILMDNLVAEAAASKSKTSWTLAFEHQSKNYHPKKNYEVVIQLLQSDMNDQENKQLAPYIVILHNLLKSLNTLGKDEAYFLVSKEENPFKIITYNDKRTIMIYSLGISTVYNTIKLTAKERASKIIASNIIPIIKNLDTNLNNSDFDYYILFLTYGSKNFLKDDDLNNLKPETLKIIIDKSVCRKFAENQLTDQELIDKSVILLSDRDTEGASVNDFTRIKINLQ